MYSDSSVCRFFVLVIERKFSDMCEIMCYSKVLLVGGLSVGEMVWML